MRNRLNFCFIFHIQNNAMKKFSLVILLLIFSGSIFAQQKQINKQLPIGVFDSRTGGLTILQAILTLDAFNNKTGEPGGYGILDFSNEAFQYLVDWANMPYGNYAAANKAKMEYIKYVPFDTNNIVPATYERFKKVLPDVYNRLHKVINGLTK